MGGPGQRERDHARYMKETGRDKRPKAYRQIEKLFLSDFCAERLPGYELHLNCPVGPLIPSQWDELLEPVEKRMLNVYRYRADCVAVGSRDVWIIEAAIRFKADHVGKLILNAALYRITPEFEKVQGRNLKLLALGSLFDAGAVLMLQRCGVELYYYRPQYVLDYLESLEFRKRRPSRVMLHYLPSIPLKKPVLGVI